MLQAAKQVEHAVLFLDELVDTVHAFISVFPLDLLVLSETILCLRHFGISV